MGVYKMLVLNCPKMLEINCHFLLESTCRLQNSRLPQIAHLFFHTSSSFLLVDLPTILITPFRVI